MEEKYALKFEILGKNIKERRIELGISLEQLSIKTKIRKEYLRKIENGKAYGINTSHLFIIASALKTLPSILAKNL